MILYFSLCFCWVFACVRLYFLAFAAGVFGGQFWLYWFCLWGCNFHCFVVVVCCSIQVGCGNEFRAVFFVLFGKFCVFVCRFLVCIFAVFMYVSFAAAVWCV